MHKQHTHTIHNYCTIYSTGTHWSLHSLFHLPAIEEKSSNSRYLVFIIKFRTSTITVHTGVRSQEGAGHRHLQKTNTFTKIIEHFYNRPSTSLVPRPSPAPVFDHLQYAKTSGSVFPHCKRSKTRAGEGLGTRLPSTALDNRGGSPMSSKLYTSIY